MGDYELYHAATRKHKYIKKIGNRYFYTQQEIAAYLEGKKSPVEFDKIKSFNENGTSKTVGGRVYYDKNKNGGYDKSIGVMKENKKITAYAPTKKKDGVKKTGRLTREYNDGFVDYTLDLSKKKKQPKKGGKLKEVKEAVAEATGRRDVYYEAKKVTENGRTYYDDDNAKLRTGKKDKNGRVDPEDGSVYTKKGTMQYDNEYTIERNKKTRARGKKKLKKMATQPVRNLKKQSSRGKKAISKFYKNNVNPGVTVTYDEAKIK